MLTWVGKRRLTQVTAYPAQHVERPTRHQRQSAPPMHCFLRCGAQFALRRVAWSNLCANDASAACSVANTSAAQMSSDTLGQP